MNEASVLILQHSERVPPAYVATFLDAQQIPYQIIRCDLPSVQYPSHTNWRAVVVLGGPQGSYEEDIHPFLKVEKAYIRSLPSHVPVLGICLGCQMMAEISGGRVFKAPHGPEVGYPCMNITEEGKKDEMVQQLFNMKLEPTTPSGCSMYGYNDAKNPPHLPHPPLLEHHGDTFELPPHATLLVKTIYPQMWRAGRWLGVQFHPEASLNEIELWTAMDVNRYGTIGRSAADVVEQVKLNYTNAKQGTQKFFDLWWKQVQEWNRTKTDVNDEKESITA